MPPRLSRMPAPCCAIEDPFVHGVDAGGTNVDVITNGSELVMNPLLKLATSGLLLLASSAAVAGETVFIVNRTIDREDSNLDDGLCRGKNVISSTQSPGLCTLRAAINQVNALAQRPGMENEQFVIKVRPGLYQLYNQADDGQQEFTDGIGLLNDLDVVAKYFRIEGISASGGVPAADERAVIRASHHSSTGFRIFDLDFDDDHAEFEFRDLVLTQGYGWGEKGGAAIACRGGGRIKLLRARVSSHTHDDENGGAINAACDIELDTTAIANNDGNGIVMKPNSQGLSLMVRYSSLTDNAESAVRLIPTSVVNLDSYEREDRDISAVVAASTVARNRVGLLFTSGTSLSVNSSTFAGNRWGIYVRNRFQEEDYVQGDYSYSGNGSPHVSISLGNSVVANSVWTDITQEQPLPATNLHYHSHGKNYFGSLSGTPPFAGTPDDMIGQGVLAGFESVSANDYTAGLLPPEGSVLLSAGSALPYGEPGACTQFDQAGTNRGFECDIGALERDDIVLLPPLEPPSDPGDPEELPPGIPPEADPQDDYIFADGF